nr:acetyl-CoA carboxylase carboxyltransferase beta subunit [Cryptolepis buchananii]
MKNSMGRWWVNSMLFKKELECRCGLNESMDSLGPIENTSEIDDSNRKDTTKNIQSSGGPDDSSYSNSDGDGNRDHIFVFLLKNFSELNKRIKEIESINEIEGDGFLDMLYCDIENKMQEALRELVRSTESNELDRYIIYNNLLGRIMDIENSLADYDFFLHSARKSSNDTEGESCNDTEGESCNDTEGESDARYCDFLKKFWEIHKDLDEFRYSLHTNRTRYCDVLKKFWEIHKGKGLDEFRYSLHTNRKSSEGESSNDTEGESSNDTEGDRHARYCDQFWEIHKGLDEFRYSLHTNRNRKSSEGESSNDTEGDRHARYCDQFWEIHKGLDEFRYSLEFLKYKHLWVLCENCNQLNYKRFLKPKMNICEHCRYHLKMSSSERIELSIDPDTWHPMDDEDLVSVDPIEFHSMEEPYKDRLCSYQKQTGLREAIQTGMGQLNGIPVAVGVMDFDFMGGSMGSVVGEKITRLIEYATNNLLPLIIVCASGGARMQEGSLSLMQMAKISSALYDYQSNKKLFYISILTSPTTGGVTASFGMLGDIIIAEPNATIAFAGKRVIEEVLKITVPEDVQTTENLFEKGLFDLIVPRNLLKSVLTELFKFHAFLPLTTNSIKTN